MTPPQSLWRAFGRSTTARSWTTPDIEVVGRNLNRHFHRRKMPVDSPCRGVSSRRRRTSPDRFVVPRMKGPRRHVNRDQTPTQGGTYASNQAADRRHVSRLAQRQVLSTIDPATEEEIVQVAEGDAVDIDLAVKAAESIRFRPLAKDGRQAIEAGCSTNSPT